jgi:hypothetical protein
MYGPGGCPGRPDGSDVWGKRRRRGADRKEKPVKYMILTYGSQKDYDAMAGKSTDHPALSPADFAPMGEFMEAFNQDLEKAGELVETRALAEPLHTRRLRNRDGAAAVTDGPYAESEEVLAGYWIVECDSFDRATEIAARLATCPSPGDMWKDGYADVRPIADSMAEMDI